MQPVAKLILKNGRFLTSRGFHAADALLIDRGMIRGFGSAGDFRLSGGRQARLIDLKGKVVLPGFTDAHAHLLTRGLLKQQADCGRAALCSLTDLIAFLRTHAAQNPRRQWLRAFGFNDANLAGGSSPTCHDLDEAVPDRPLILTRVCTHISILNSRAMQLLGLNRETADPPGGRFVRDADGELTGRVEETAQDLVLKSIPGWSQQELVTAVENGQQGLFRRGICAIHDPGTDQVAPKAYLDAYLMAAAEGRLKVRTYLMARPTEADKKDPDPWLENLHILKEQLSAEGRLHLGAVKFFMDGSIGARTAMLNKPYADPAGGCGPQLDTRGLGRMIAAVHRHGFQASIHAIGDRAVAAAIALIEKAMERCPRPDPRHRIEHSELCSAQDLTAMRRLGIVPVLQPVFLYLFGDHYRDALGDLRTHGMKPHRQMLDNGLKVALGSDWPVAAPDVGLGLQTAVCRRTITDKPIGADQAVTLTEAIQGYTGQAAHAAFMEQIAGSLEIGKFADMVVLEEDPYQVPAQRLAQVGIAMTIINGEVVYQH